MSTLDDFDVIWDEPPPTGKYGTRLERFVNKLKDKPGEWGQLPPYKNDDGEETFYPLSVLTTLRKAYGERVDYTSRATDTVNRNRIWARWVEPDDPEHEAGRKLRPVRPTN